MSWKFGQYLKPRSGIYLVNQSAALDRLALDSIADACALQLRRDVAPAYQREPVRVQTVDKVEHAPAGARVVLVLEDPAQEVLLGHAVVGVGGRVFSRVFARSAMKAGITVSSLISHQVIEAFIDPAAARWRTVFHPGTDNSMDFAYDVVDPVEDGTYITGGHMLANFVHPRWFDPEARYGRFDQMGQVAEPFAWTSGGSVVVRFSTGRIGQMVGCCHLEARNQMRAGTVLARSFRRGFVAEV